MEERKKVTLKVVGAHELEMRIGVGKLRHIRPIELDQKLIRVNNSKDT